ncbi:amidase domain-containing protein [Oceanobacillus damuensis]|uniref:amidase domain-containing protein n=1 Tax=Oceanobacillus damuensis TaxID=937928 RepID=UPI000831FBC2|nr:amidase domain-containing protein [Oceanobacillus damuensis]
MEKIKKLWLDFFHTEREQGNWWTRKENLWSERNAEIIRVQGNGSIFQKLRYDGETHYRYFMHLKYVIRQNKKIHIEEQVLPYQFRLADGILTNHAPIEKRIQENKKEAPAAEDDNRKQANERFSYDRLSAVQYAERWWNNYNPAYRMFDVDCTNYVSQCLRAGGAPMWGSPVRERGWWYGSNTWSFSWAVAHSLRWYLSGATQGLRGKEVERADQLIPGDIICYDFQGDGRWDHNTIVVAKDAEGMPLVNAHTDNSRNRYWSYEDSTAWTPDINYKFFRIGDD